MTEELRPGELTSIKPPRDNDPRYNPPTEFAPQRNALPSHSSPEDSLYWGNFTWTRDRGIAPLVNPLPKKSPPTSNCPPSSEDCPGELSPIIPLGK